MAAAAESPRLSVILPALNEGAGIAAVLWRLQALRRRGHEVLLVDGQSDDDTVVQAAPLVDRVLHSPCGRAVQMHAGAQAANGAVFWFLHADTLAPEDADRIILSALREQGRDWGRFDVRIDGPASTRPVAWLMNLRSRLSGIATGDQGIFVTRAAYLASGGYAPIPLMEDIALCRVLRRSGRPVVLRQTLLTSGRRWRKHGVLRTVLTMWLLRSAYYLGISPARLAARYRTHDA